MRTLKRPAGLFSTLLLSVFFVSAVLAFPVSASGNLPRPADMADLLSDGEKADLSDMPDEVSVRQRADIMAATADSTDGELYDIDNPRQEPFGFAGNLAAAFGLAFLISLVVTGVMKGRLKSVHSRSAADNYVKQGSMQLTKKNDLFLYQRVERRKKAVIPA